MLLPLTEPPGGPRALGSGLPTFQVSDWMHFPWESCFPVLAVKVGIAGAYGWQSVQEEVREGAFP